MSSFENFNPASYHLHTKQVMELNETLERLTTTCLGDFSVYRKHPEWFIKCPKSGRIDYDPKIGIRMIVEARRALRAEEKAEDLLDETLAYHRPNRKALSAAREKLADFIKAADHCAELRGKKDTRPDELAFFVHDVPSRLGDVRLASGIIPEPCIRACEDMCAAVIQPCPPEKAWEQAINSASTRSVTIS